MWKAIVGISNNKRSDGGKMGKSVETHWRDRQQQQRWRTDVQQDGQLHRLSTPATSWLSSSIEWQLGNMDDINNGHGDMIISLYGMDWLCMELCFV